MIRLSGKVFCETEAEARLVASLLPEHIRLSRAEAGCLSFSVEPGEDPLVWNVEESFRDEAGFEAHQLRTRQSDWYLATAHLRREYRISRT